MTLQIELRCKQFPLIILEMPLQLDWSPPAANSIDWIWFRKKHNFLYKVPQLTVHVRAETPPWSPRYEVREVEFQDKMVRRHGPREGYKTIYRVLKVPKSTVSSIIRKWTKYGTTQTLPRAGHPTKLSNRARRTLVMEVTKNTMTTLTELQSSLAEMVEPARRPIISAALHKSRL